jgi:hypothetical protein
MVEQPRITSKDELHAWLEGKPHPWAQVIAVRAALRVLPIISHALDKDYIAGDWESRLIITIARADFTASAVLLDRNLGTITAAANAAESKVNVPFTANGYAAYAACAAAKAAADDDANAAADAAAYAYYANANANAIWQSISKDANWLEASKLGTSSEQAITLLQQSLWHGNAPARLHDAWHHFAHSPFAAEYGFQPWIQWYEGLAALDGTTPPRFLFSKALTLRIATQPNKWWKRPALEINTDIARWLAEEQTVTSAPSTDDLPTQLTEALDQLPSQQPAPYQFDWRDGRMEVLPPEALPEDGGIAQDYLDETREKADSLFERLERTNTDPDIRRKIGKLLDVLTERVADLRPALVKSRSLSITALADAHNTPQDERELSAGVLADLIDLDLTAKELCASLPDLARQDIERLVDAMASVEDAETARSGLDAIRLSAEEAELLGPAAQAALAGLSEDAAEPAAPALKKRRVALFMATVRNLLLKALRVPGMVVKAAAGALWRFMKDSGKEFRGLLVKGTAYSLLVAAGTAPIYFVATQTEAISVVARYAEGFKDIEQILKLAGRLRTPPE